MSDDRKLDPRIEEGARVLIVGSYSESTRNRRRKNNFVGFTGKISSIFNISGDKYPYSIVFDDKDMQSRNIWCWSKDEIMYLEDQSYVK